MKKFFYLLFLSLICALQPIQAAVETPTRPIQTRSTGQELPAQPIEPQKMNRRQLKKQLKSQLLPKKSDVMFPNSLAWTGVIMMIAGLLMVMIFGATIIASVGTILATVGLLLVIVWIIQRLAYL